MLTAKSFRLTFLAILMAVLLPACATATRGSHTLFVVETAPVGAKAEITLPVKKSPKISRTLRAQIASGEADIPEFIYGSCEPTPCGIKVPRRSDFHVMVSKEGYEPIIAEIGHLHRKEIKKETIRNTAIAAGATTAAGAVAVTSALASVGATVTAGSALAVGAVVAAPVVLVGGVALGVDAATGANYDLWPNPLPLALRVTSAESEEFDDKLRAEFAKLQKARALEPPLSSKSRKQKRAETKLRLREALRAQNENQGGS